MNMVEIIEKKKQGLALTEAEIRLFVEGAATGSVPDYQLAALLMAIRLKGMTAEETLLYAMGAGMVAISSENTINPNMSVEAIENMIKEYIV